MMSQFSSLTKSIVAALTLATCLSAVTQAQEEKEEKKPDELALRTSRTGQDESPPQSQELTKFFAGELMMANYNSIALSKIAAEQASNEQVKTFAQTIIADHKALNEKLAKIAHEVASMLKKHVDPLQREGRSEVIGDLQVREEESTSPSDTSSRTDLPKSKARTQSSATTQHSPLMEVCKIYQEASQEHLQMAKQMLMEKQGQDFDMAFLGMQIGTHAWLLAQAHALQDVGSSEFQQAVQEASKVFEHHLNNAKQLAQELEDDRRIS